MNGISANAAYPPNMTPETSRVPEVSNEMETLLSRCDFIDKQVSQLEQRLMTVLAQRGDAGNVDGQKHPEPVRVPLAQAIHDRSYHLMLLSDRLQSIIDRIEV